MKGLEPPRLAAPDPKSDASTNSATSAIINPENQDCNFLITSGKYSIFLFVYFIN